ncbi:uncharacterized protein LOC132037214 [Lycium ferocissimum]|uniref:uncharacterized protein LOC132037214 n=1 Tax=Lycium ferocissimum TaxID=112874 RepID=UPI002814E912|nr:uncharacterized protein LOC132037214 [Lycium ferocissimum]
MNVPNLTWRQVANHLQKYRLQRRQAQHIQPATSSIANQYQIISQTPSPLVPISHGEKQHLNIESTIGNFSSVSQMLDFPDNGHHFNMRNHFADNGHHFNVGNSNDFPMSFNEPLQEAYLPQPPAVPSLVPSNDLFTGLNGWNQEPKLNNFTDEIMTENQTSTHVNSNEFSMDFNEQLQEAYLPQPPAVPSLAPPNDLFTGLNGCNHDQEFDNFIAEMMTENQIDTYYRWPSMNPQDQFQYNKKQ